MLAAATAVAALALPVSPGVLTGTVTRGPISPVCRVGTPCTAPARQLVLVFRRNGTTTRTRTDGAGRYRIRLPAGVWRITLTRTGLGTAVEPGEVRVIAARTRHVDLSIDTGIR
jgi:hypothetical protein